MSILKSSLPSKYNFSFQIPTPKPVEFLPAITMKPLNTSIVEQIFQEITHPAKALSVTAIFFLIILIFICVLICLCMCSPCFRTWFRTCTFFKNPKTWWTTYKNYEVPAFNKIAPSKSFFNRLRVIKLPFYSRHVHDNVPDTNIETPPANRPIQEQPKSNTEHSYSRYDSDLYPKVIFSQGDRHQSDEPFARIRF